MSTVKEYHGHIVEMNIMFLNDTVEWNGTCDCGEFIGFVGRDLKVLTRKWKKHVMKAYVRDCHALINQLRRERDDAYEKTRTVLLEIWELSKADIAKAEFEEQEFGERSYIAARLKGHSDGLDYAANMIAVVVSPDRAIEPTRPASAS